MICYFGELPYQYGRFRHEPNPLNSNPFIAEFKNIVRDIYPNISFNSALINYYPNAYSRLALHSDDEEEIVNDSYILTISLGQTRRLVFATRQQPSTPICNVVVEHRSLIIFSKASQHCFRHGVLPYNDGQDDKSKNIGRVSITLRLLASD